MAKFPFRVDMEIFLPYIPTSISIIIFVLIFIGGLFGLSVGFIPSCFLLRSLVILCGRLALNVRFCIMY